MSDPFRIEGPAVISFSGGRTSGYMLRRVLDSGLQPDVHVLFADTGRERDETYQFVRECEEQWSVPIHWVKRPGYFTQLITDRRTLPNPAQRWCTQELKIRPMRDWMVARGYEHWLSVVGIRADEPRRIAKMREANEARKERWEVVLPLADAGVMLADVTGFWRAQPFDLRLRPWEGNCTICFLKHVAKRERIAKDRPDLLAWWVEQERRTGQFFRLSEPDYATLPRIGNFFDQDDDELAAMDDGIACHCTD
jgi:hypothetical protein